MSAPVAWSAVRLDQVRTEVLAGLDLRHGPPAIARQVRRTLAARRREGEPVPRPREPDDDS